MTTNHTTTLLARIEDGDQEAENILFGRLMGELLNVGCGLLAKFDAPEVDAEDLVQEFYIKSFRKIGATRFNNSQHMIRVAYKRMYWTIHDILKRHRMLQPGTHQLTEEALSDTGIATRVAKDNLVEIAWAEMESLPEDLRIVVQRRLTDGLTYREISEELDISPSTAHDRFERAIELLRGILKIDDDPVD